MPTRTRAPIIAGTVLGVLSLLVWGILLATLADLDASDAMGKALTEGFASLEIIVLWVLLGVLLIVATVGGAMPGAVALMAAVLLIASGFAAISAVELLAYQNIPPFYWPILTPTLVPLIVVAFCFWGLLPSVRARVPAGLASGTALGAIFVLSAVVLPMNQIRDRAVQREATEREKWASEFARLGPNAPLWDWTPFLRTRDETRQEAVLARIRKLDRRQTEAEIMLDRGDFPLAYLGRFDLDPTPSICEKARGQLGRRVQFLVAKTPGSRPYADVAEEVEGALAAMNWLVGYGCSCDAEALAWEAMAGGYRDTNFDVHELAELRDPKALSSRLLQSPDRFSMLTPRAHLRAWLKFAHDKDTSEPALEGARRLEHRTADAVEMLDHDEYEAATVLAYMPALDLEATEPLCNSSLRVLHDRFTGIYRPRPDDPRSYAELLGRLGADSPLTALQWLASQGCDADAALREAEEIVRDYQDSPERAEMLASLARVHRKP